LIFGEGIGVDLNPADLKLKRQALNILSKARNRKNKKSAVAKSAVKGCHKKMRYKGVTQRCSIEFLLLIPKNSLSLMPVEQTRFYTTFTFIKAIAGK
jgi:hypothetical protein